VRHVGQKFRLYFDVSASCSAFSSRERACSTGAFFRSTSAVWQPPAIRLAGRLFIGLLEAHVGGLQLAFSLLRNCSSKPSVRIATRSSGRRRHTTISCSRRQG